MARIRTIKPEFWEDAIIGTLSREARLLFIAAWNLADDAGRLRWSAAYLKAGAFIYDEDISQEMVSGYMAELVSTGLVSPYTSSRGKQEFGHIVNFLKHQKISHPTPSRLPEPPNVPCGTLTKDSEEIPSLSENNPREVEVEVEREIEAEGKAKSGAPIELDRQVERIGHTHPKNHYLKGQFLPNRQQLVIAEAVIRHGFEAVMNGTRACKAAFTNRPREDLCYAPEPVRFFRESEYLKDPVVWEKQFTRAEIEEIRERERAQVGVYRP